MERLMVLVFSLALTQSQDYHPGILNPDKIYFNDGGQLYPQNVLLNLKQRIQSNLVQAAQNLQQHPRPANLIPQASSSGNPGGIQAGQPGPPGVNPVHLQSSTGNIDANSLKRPSPTLEAPHFSNNGNADRVEQNLAVDRFGDFTDAGFVVKQPPTIVVNQLPVARKGVSTALSDFGINLLKIMQPVPGNVIMSPYSIGSMLGLLLQGSEGVTRLQISNALQMDPNEADEGFKRLSENLQKRNSNNIFKVGSGVFLSESFDVNPVFKRVAINDFNSDVTTLKFTRPAQAAAKINTWVAEKTNNKISQFLGPDSLDETTQLALINAVYFKGLWKVKFLSQYTKPGNFFLPNGNQKIVQYMWSRTRDQFRYGYDSGIDAQVVVMPFDDNQYSLVVILPGRNRSISSTISSLTSEKLREYQSLDLEEVNMFLPKFNIKSNTDLMAVFRQLGITKLFGTTSDLAGLGSSRELGLQVSSALHSALLSIDEEGSVAAAASYVGAIALTADDETKNFIVNRPFIAVIWDKQTSVPLFMAKIEDPVL